MDKIHHVSYRHGNAAFKAAFDAAFPGLPQGMSMEEAERRMTAALIAYDGVRWTERAEYGEKREMIESAARLGRQMGEVLVPACKKLHEEAARAGDALRECLPALAATR